jgi:hypothetical protein
MQWSHAFVSCEWEANLDKLYLFDPRKDLRNAMVTGLQSRVCVKWPLDPPASLHELTSPHLTSPYRS